MSGVWTTSPTPNLVQTALAKVVPHWERIDGDPERYVRRVLVRESVTRWRRRRWREVTVEHLPEPAVAGDERSATDRLALRQALGRLSPRQRAVVVLRFYDDLPVAEVAELLGCTTGTVKSQTHDALARLRTLLPDVPDADLPPDALSPAAGAPARRGSRPTR